jgi:hypothetical protein
LYRPYSEYLDQPYRFTEAGITHVLIKPCPPDVIASELRRLLNIDARVTQIA